MLSSCLLCSHGTKCRGYMLHEPMLKIHAAISHCAQGGDELTAITRELTRQDMEILAEYGEKARVTCWSKGFVLALSHLLAQTLAQPELKDEALDAEVERVVAVMAQVVAHLPHNTRIDLPALEMDIHNHTLELMAKRHCRRMFPGRTFAQACKQARAG